MSRVASTSSPAVAACLQALPATACTDCCQRCQPTVHCRTRQAELAYLKWRRVGKKIVRAQMPPQMKVQSRLVRELSK